MDLTIPGLIFTGEYVSVPEVEDGKPLPLYQLDGWLETIEGGNIFSPLENKPLREAVKEIYHRLDRETQNALMYSPEGAGAWIERARFWRYVLHEALEPRLAHLAMEYILDWYIHRFTWRPTLHVATAWGEPTIHR